MKREVLDEAESLLAKVLALAPDYAPARYDYALVLLRRHRNLEAFKQAEASIKGGHFSLSDDEVDAMLPEALRTQRASQP